MKMIDIAEFRARVKAGRHRPKTAVRFAPTSSVEPIAAKDARSVTFVFSDNSVDRYGDTIDARGWVLDTYNANPIALFGHDSSNVKSVIGSAKNVRVEGHRLIGDIDFMEASVNPDAEAVYQMVKGGFLRAVSVGFQPIEWSLSKDKGRPGGVDFRKQELLEISIVPIPANPNALVQARAAGIDVDRLALVQPKAPVSKKGLYEVGALARLLVDLGYLEDMVEWEEDYEGDGSDISQRLTDAMKMLGQILVDMTAEEVAELFEEEDGADPIIISGDVTALAALSPVQKAMRALACGLRSPVARSVQKVAIDIELTSAAQEVLGRLERAGKVLSSSNEKSLRDAHSAITQGCETIKSVLDAAAQPEASGDELAIARARRVREAEALKIASAS